MLSAARETAQIPADHGANGNGHANVWVPHQTQRGINSSVNMPGAGHPVGSDNVGVLQALLAPRLRTQFCH